MANINAHTCITTLKKIKWGNWVTECNHPRPWFYFISNQNQKKKKKKKDWSALHEDTCMFPDLEMEQQNS